MKWLLDLFWILFKTIVKHLALDIPVLVSVKLQQYIPRSNIKCEATKTTRDHSFLRALMPWMSSSLNCLHQQQFYDAAVQHLETKQTQHTLAYAIADNRHASLNFKLTLGRFVRERELIEWTRLVGCELHDLSAGSNSWILSRFVPRSDWLGWHVY